MDSLLHTDLSKNLTGFLTNKISTKLVFFKHPVEGSFLYTDWICILSSKRDQYPRSVVPLAMFQFSLSTQQIIMWRSVPNTHVSKCPCLEAFSLVLCSILSLRYWESTFSEDFLCYTPAEACLLPTGCIMASQTPSVWLIQHTALLVCTHPLASNRFQLSTLLTALESSGNFKQSVAADHRVDSSWFEDWNSDLIFSTWGLVWVWTVLGGG